MINCFLPWNTFLCSWSNCCIFRALNLFNARIMTIYGVKLYSVRNENTSWCVCALMSVFLNFHQTTYLLFRFVALSVRLVDIGCGKKSTLGCFIQANLQMLNSTENYDGHESVNYCHLLQEHTIYKLHTRLKECSEGRSDFNTSKFPRGHAPSWC